MGSAQGTGVPEPQNLSAGVVKAMKGTGSLRPVLSG